VSQQAELPGHEQAVKLVREIIEARFSSSKAFIPEVHLVWFTKVLQNWKALVYTREPIQAYFEVTYSGAEERVYIDTYHKVNHIAISLGDDSPLS
jgi:hypothetical protein